MEPTFKPPTLAETALEIALNLFHEGRYPDARLVLHDLLSREDGLDEDEVLAAKIRLAVVEHWDGEEETASRIYTSIAPLVDASRNFLLKGKYYDNLEYLYRCQGKKDEAIETLTAAEFYYEQAGEIHLSANTNNNLGILLAEAERFEDAHLRFDLALKHSPDLMIRAQICDSKAQAYCAERRFQEALPYARKAVELVEGTDRQPLLRAHLRTLRIVCEELERQYKVDDERPIIEAALRSAGGRSTAAARILNMTRRTLDFKLENYHQDLLPLRAEKKKARGIHAPRPRRRKAKNKASAPALPS